MEKNFEVSFHADDTNAALNAALDAGLVCRTCTGKIATLTEMDQSDFCAPCQAVISSQLSVILERRISEVLNPRGLPPDSVKIQKH